MTKFAATHPEYASVWREETNTAGRSLIRRRLASGTPTIVVLQPGDGTRYRFLLTPAPDQVEISDNGRGWRVQQAEDFALDGKPALYVTILDGLGEGTASIARRDKIDGIRHRIAESMMIRNACTAEALARTIEAGWSKSRA